MAVTCVGSVLNYTDASRTLFEISRVLRRRGKLILEYERSESIEYLFTSHYRRPASPVTVSMVGEEQTIWIYSDAYILKLLTAAGLRLIRRKRFHILSALANRLIQRQESAAKLAQFDKLTSSVPVLRWLGSNTILACEKT